MDNQTQLKKLHRSLLELLTEFDRICKKYGIQYFLDSGTALGAIRHGGFIPWDDDADVGMLRSDYEKFLKVAPRELLNKFVLQTRLNDPMYFKHHAKLRLLGTYYPELHTEMFKYQGIFIDIFPFDYVSKFSIFRKIDHFFVRYFRSRTWLRRFKNTRNSNYHKIIGFFLDKIPESFLEKLYLWAESRHKKGSWLTCYEYMVCQKKIKIFNVNTLNKTQSILFENKSFFIMSNYNEYLMEMYGNYMEIPQKNNRSSHIVDSIIFDKNIY